MGYTGFCPRVYQSGDKDLRGPIARNGLKYLRWALIEAAVHASSHPVYKDHYDRTKARLGRHRGAKVARIEVASKLAEAVWPMRQTGSTFAPARSPATPLVA
jgi:transposase